MEMKRKAKSRKKPDKKELAKMKVMNNLGHSPSAIAKKMGKSHHTVIKYLEDQAIFDDPQIQKLMEKIEQRETYDLSLLGAKARRRLHELLDQGDTKVIETTAVMDRTFEQRRLLEGKSTQNLDFGSLTRQLKENDKKEAALRAELADLLGDKTEGSCNG